MKKRISFILAAVMLVCNMAISVFAADKSTATFTDVSSKTQYSEAILTLVKLGVINGYEEEGVKTFKPEGEITRAEFTAIITRAMRIAENVGGNVNFTDVEGHWAKNNIIAATGYKITNGFEDNTFRPDEKVTYEQAVKMIVCALNYGSSAEAAGGWPDGYMNQGAILGLVKGVSASVIKTAPSSRGVVAQLMYNALDIKVADPKTSVASDDTFLNRFMNMEMITGKIVGVEENTTVECDQTLALDEMAVYTKNKELVTMDFANYEDQDSIVKYLGQQALVFYKIAPNGGLNELVILDVELTKNDVTEVSFEDVHSYSDGFFEFFNASGKKEKLDFKTDEITLFYNKKAVSDDVEEKLEKWLDPDSEEFIYGSVTFTDSGDDGSIEMVEVMDYDYLVATKAPSSSDYKVLNKMKFKNSANAGRVIDNVVLNPEKKTPQFTLVNESGAAMNTTAIKANSVVLVAESENGDVITALASAKKVEGEVQSFNEEELTLYIEGEKYSITEECIAYLSEDEQGTPLKNGMNATFYLDAFGTIAYGTVSSNTSSAVTVYIVSALFDEDKDLVTVRAYVPGSGYQSYTFDKKIKIDGNLKEPAVAYEDILDSSNRFKNMSVFVFIVYS